MVKLFSGILLIFVCIEELVRTFSHHFYPMVDDIGKQSLVFFVLIFFGMYLIFSAGKDYGKNYFDDEWGGSA